MSEHNDGHSPTNDHDHLHNDGPAYDVGVAIFHHDHYGDLRYFHDGAVLINVDRDDAPDYRDAAAQRLNDYNDGFAAGVEWAGQVAERVTKRIAALRASLHGS